MERKNIKCIKLYLIEIHIFHVTVAVYYHLSNRVDETKSIHVCKSFCFIIIFNYYYFVIILFFCIYVLFCFIYFFSFFSLF